jgi:hypothetical protein
VILASVTAALVLAMLWDLVGTGAGTQAPRSRRLVPDCAVTRVVWERPDAAPVTLERISRTEHALRVQQDGQEVTLAAEPRVAEDVLGTIELLAYRRALPARRAERGLERPRVRVRVTCEGQAGRAITLALGEHVAAMDRVWLARTDQGGPHAAQAGTDYLIEGYAARAIDRAPGELRARRIFTNLGPDGPGESGRIEIRQGERALVVTGRPALALLAGHPDLRVRADAGQVSALVHELRGLAMARFLDGAAPGDPGSATALSIRVRDRAGTITLQALGPCPAAPATPAGDAALAAAPEALRLVITEAAAGCVAADALAAITAFLDTPMLARTLVEPPGTPGASWQRLRVVRPDGLGFTLAPRGGDFAMTVEQGGEEIERTSAEPEAVRAWLGALAGAASGAFLARQAPGAPASTLPAPTLPASTLPAPTLPASTLSASTLPAFTLPASTLPAFTLIVQRDEREDTIDVYRDPRAPRPAPRWLAWRHGDPVYLVLDVAPHAAAIEPVDPLRFRPRTVLAAEPFALREVIARTQGRLSEHLVRGQLLGDWDARVPARASVRPGVVDALRQAVARLHALRFVAAAPVPAHRLAPPRRGIEAVFDPGPLDGDTPIRHHLDLGADTAQGCLGRLDGQGPVFELDRQTCDTLLGPWTAPR